MSTWCFATVSFQPWLFFLKPHPMSAPDPAELHHGRRLTVKAWFDEFEACSCVTRDSSIRDKE